MTCFLLFIGLKIAEVALVVFVPYWVGKVCPEPNYLPSNNLFVIWFIGFLVSFLMIFLTILLIWIFLNWLNWNWKLTHNGQGIGWIERWM